MGCCSSREPKNIGDLPREKNPHENGGQRLTTTSVPKDFGAQQKIIPFAKEHRAERSQGRRGPHETWQCCRCHKKIDITNVEKDEHGDFLRTPDTCPTKELIKFFQNGHAKAGVGGAMFGAKAEAGVGHGHEVTRESMCGHERCTNCWASWRD